MIFLVRLLSLCVMFSRPTDPEQVPGLPRRACVTAGPSFASGWALGLFPLRGRGGGRCRDEHPCASGCVGVGVHFSLGRTQRWKRQGPWVSLRLACWRACPAHFQSGGTTSPAHRRGVGAPMAARPRRHPFAQTVPGRQRGDTETRECHTLGSGGSCPEVKQSATTSPTRPGAWVRAPEDRAEEKKPTNSGMKHPCNQSYLLG